MNVSPASRDRLSWAIVLSACLLQIALGTTLARTTLPFCDEGFYGVPAHVLSVTGSLRNPVMESAGVPYLRGIDRVFYWMAPMGMVLQAAAFKVFGFGLLVQRGLSVLCGLGAVLFWFVALRRLIGDRVAALSALLLSVDSVFLSLSSRGRSDIISLFLAMAALAAYMHWRERSLSMALALANTACGLSGMVHPNGGIAALASLAVMTLYLDRKRLGWRHMAIVALCYGVLSLGWGLYIAKAPHLFIAQFFGNVAGRLGGRTSVTRLIGGEVARYVSAYGLEDAHGIKLVRYLFPVLYLSAVLFCAFSKDLCRRSAILLLMFLAVSLTLVFLEGAKQGWYLVNLSPLFCAFLALTMYRLWNSGHVLARTVAVAQSLLVVLGVASLIYSAANQRLERVYDPAVAFLNTHLTSSDVVFARSEFYFGLHCRTCLRDDANLGEFSGQRADYIVLEPDYTEHLSELRDKKPALYGDIEGRLNANYKEVFHNAAYRILRRTT
ncbi:MAG TPA: glycosyltransferase family 39 protein [Bryobacteraceae bacterium]|nr:glycosyltransferase family 39 protein [Bryobacteraceae bacterium]